jgi:hypothetical protein
MDAYAVIRNNTDKGRGIAPVVEQGPGKERREGRREEERTNAVRAHVLIPGFWW